MSSFFTLGHSSHAMEAWLTLIREHKMTAFGGGFARRRANERIAHYATSAM